MIQFTPHMRILVATTPLDMRRGMDGIATHCRLALGKNPMSGAVFLFISRSRKHLRILTYDGQGYWVATKGSRRADFPRAPSPVTKVLARSSGGLRPSRRSSWFRAGTLSRSGFWGRGRESRKQLP